jgi:hypothetical protein
MKNKFKILHLENRIRKTNHEDGMRITWVLRKCGISTKFEHCTSNKHDY